MQKAGKAEYSNLFRINPITFIAVYYEELLDNKSRSCLWQDMKILAEFLPRLEYLNLGSFVVI